MSSDPAPLTESGRVVIDAAELWRPIEDRSAALRAERRSALFRRRWRAYRIDLIALLPFAALSVAIGKPTGPLLAVAISLSYFFLCESLTGQTLGKRIAGLRVVRLDGGPLNLAAVAARNLLLLVDTLGLCLVGVLAVTVTPQRQRIGDLVAGTVVTVADDHAHVPSRQRGRLAILVGYPVAWIGAALVVGALAGGAKARDSYLRLANTTCTSTRSAVASNPDAGLVELHASLADLERTLRVLEPPAGMRAAHLRLVTAIHRERALLGRATRARRSELAGLAARYRAMVAADGRTARADGFPGCA
jgi:uncharacterized RDD family membrane protein YckC